MRRENGGGSGMAIRRFLCLNAGKSGRKVSAVPVSHRSRHAQLVQILYSTVKYSTIFIGGGAAGQFWHGNNEGWLYCTNVLIDANGKKLRIKIHQFRFN
jgi:hypothetical protein